MKQLSYRVLFIIMLINIWTLYSVAQVSEDQEKIWSVVKLQPTNIKEPKIENNWVPAEQVPKFYDFESGITVSPNFRPKPTTNSTQSETSVDVHPTNNNIIFCSANATDYPVSQVYGTGVYWSVNGSSTWTGYDNPPFGGNDGDPASVIGPDGRFYENYISSSGGQGVAVSTNNGASWSTYTVAPNPGSLADKNHYMVDKKSGSPFLNRSYCAWTDFGGTNDEDVVFRYSTNYGQTWSSTINLSSSLSAFNHGVNIQTGPNGEVYATWAVYIGTNLIEDAIAFAKSTNGGVSWSTPIYVYQHTDFGIRGTLSSKSGIRVSSFPSMAVDRSGGSYDGYIYITWPQRGVSPAGSDPDIVYVKSTNGGTTWSSPVRVNDDPLNNGKDQYYPWCTVDQSTGQFMIVFYDSRDVVNSQANVYMARSLDGGASFENFIISDQPHTPAPISGLASGYAGDYIGVAAYNNVAYPYWGDNRTGIYQGWMAKVTFGPLCPVDAPSNPNPSNGATSVSVNLTQLSWTNGSGATSCEVWFGVSGSLTKVYDGIVSSSWTIPSTLDYNTTYNWQIVDKNDTCGTSGPVWAFTTELSPGVVFMENFNNLNCWSAIGPLGTTNWSTQSTSNAGGTAPELRLSWTPQFNGLSKLVSCPISALNNRHYSVSLKHMVDWYANPAPTLGIGVSYDNGSTYTSVWSITPTGNVGPETIEASFTTPVSDSPDAINLYLVLYCNGNSYNINYWYVDDIILNDDDYFSVADPTNVSATSISSSQIDIAFTPNANDNNIVVVWNLTGTFATPTGTPPAVGQPFAGGTLLYNGTTSPIHHNGLSPLTAYYYKLFSYNGTNYSPGVDANATTLNVADPTNVTATPINGSQIDVAFTPNANNDNVVVVWNLTGTFTTPAGTPPAVGQPFAGGTLLYNGTTSPVHHNGLSPLTAYYYKLYSYDGTNYSQGVDINATTLNFEQAAVDFTIHVHDNAGSSSTINFGLDLTATDGIDGALGEAALPGPPPENGYYAAWILPDGITQSYLDYRAPGDPPAFPFTGNKQHSIKIQSTDYPMTISWSLPSTIAATSTIMDPFGGTFVNASFSGTDSVIVTLAAIPYLVVSIDYIGIDSVETFELSVLVQNGWNMVSAPGINPAGMGVTDWWPDLTGTVWGFDGTVYVATTSTTPGFGYWMKNVGAETYDYPEIEIVPHDPIPGHQNWNIIGVYENSIATSGITTDPPGQKTGTVWGFNGTIYVAATTLVPGYSYWIKLLSACNIIIPEPPLAKGSGEVADYFKADLPTGQAGWGRIILTDAAGISFTLYAVKGEVDLDQYEMPPVPPAGMFDVRYSSGRVAEDISSTVKTIDMQGITYPLTVRTENMDIRLMDETSKVINQNLKAGEEVVISDATIQKLMVTGELIPDKYALEQNYPNPFNPSTVIEFSLPEDVSNVKLSIYNVLGEKVAELVNTSLIAGKYSYQWDARNVATGMYIYELRTDKFVSVKKMVLMK